MSSTNGTTPDSLAKVPRHVAIIMDGNGRWATSRGLPRVEGHRQGAKSVRSIVEESAKLGVRHLTLFSFSTENWQRPKDEVNSLMELFALYLEKELSVLASNGIRLRAIGDLDRLPTKVSELLHRVTQETKDLTRMDLVLAMSYGGRDEITSAVRRIAAKVKRGELEVGNISEATVAAHLHCPELPDPDLMIRTSGEFRISNFLLWQLAYTEIVVSKAFWPDFTVEEYHRCLTEFASRSRRFGMVQTQVNSNEARG